MFPAISSIFYDDFDPIYRKEVLKLFNQIEELKLKKEKHFGRKAFILWNEFSSKYLMPKKLWDMKMNFIKHFSIVYKQQIAAKYYYHFGHLPKNEQRFINLPTIRHKILCYNLKKDLLVSARTYDENVCYLQRNIEKSWRDYEIHDAESIIQRSEYRRFEKIKLLFPKILAVEDNVAEWFKALMESDDFEFIGDNVELRLYENVGNKILWKLYLEFLQNTGQYVKLVEIYSKYCRYFMKDSEMLKEYQKTAETICPSVVPWKNAKSFEIYSENLLKYYLLGNAAASVPLPLCRHFSGETASAQKFPFRLSLMNYILKTAKASILFDLFKTCKWFYCYHPIGIIYKFNTYMRHKFNKYMWLTDGIRHQTINIANPNQLQLPNKIFISTVFCFKLHKPDLMALSNFIPKIYRCSAKCVEIENQHLTFDELKFLIGHGEVVELIMSVKDQKGNPFKFEDIISFLPKIQKLIIKNMSCSPHISQVLCDFQFQNKIEDFYFGVVEILSDPYAFAEFILKNASTNSTCFFRFCNHFVQENANNENFELDDLNVADNEETRAFKSVVNNIINESWKGPYQPYFMLL